MKNLTSTVTTLICILFIFGCATGGMRRGVIVMKMGPNDAHVSLGGDEVKVGDHVDLYRSVCPAPYAPRGGEPPGKCVKEGKGHGEVVEIMSEHYSIVKFSNGVDFKEGDLLEKKIH